MHELSYSITQWLLHYGILTLFALLALGIVGLPIPDETLLAFAGFLIAQGKLSLLPTVLAAFAGSVCGISLSYVIGGTAGYYLIKTYGKKIGMTPQRIQQVHNWFARIGKWTLTVGYFFPGIRHLTGYVAGASRLHYAQFALFAYSGAMLWVGTFIILGYYFGEHWFSAVHGVNNVVIVILVIVIILLFGWMGKEKK